MKIVLNIEKRHLIFFSLFLVLVGGIFVIAGTDPGRGANNIAKIGHEFLYVNQIKPFNLPGFIEIGKQGEGTAVKIWDPKGNYMVIGGTNVNNRFDFKVGRNTDILFFGEGADYKFNNFIIKSKNICSSENNCVSTEGFINKIITGLNEGVETRYFTGEQIKVSSYRILGDQLSADRFCQQEIIGYERASSFNVINCSESIRFRGPISDGGWTTPLSCNEEQYRTYKILESVTCEKYITPEAVIAHQNSYEGWGNGNWEKTCPEGKNMIGLKQEYDHEDKVTAKLICQ